MHEASHDNSKHVAVLAFPFGSHVPPLLNLVRRLSANDPTTKFSFFTTAQCNRATFDRDENLENIETFDVSDGLPQDYKFAGNPKEPMELFIKAAPDSFRQALVTAEEEKGKKFGCLISDAFFWFGADLADEFGAAWVPLWTAGHRSLLLHLETDLIRNKIGFHDPKDKTMEFIPGCSEIRAIDLPQEVFIEDSKSQFAKMLHNMGLNLPRAKAVAVNSFEEIDPTSLDALKSKLPNLFSVGPFALASPRLTFSDADNVLQWLDSQKAKSVVYISFGSASTPEPEEIQALAEVLEEGGYAFLWSMRGNAEEKLPKGFLEKAKERGKVVSWVPQVKVLQHEATEMFVTHGGWNSVVESIISGVPMICRPFFGDHPLNAREVEIIWKVGVNFKGGKITKEDALGALNFVRTSDEGGKMRVRLQRLKELAFDAVKPQGSSTRNFESLANIVTATPTQFSN